MKSPIRRIQWAILEAVTILEEELSNTDSESEMDPDDIQQTVMVFDDLRNLLQGKGFIVDRRDGRRARSQEPTRRGRAREREPHRSSSAPAPESPKVRRSQNTR